MVLNRQRIDIENWNPIIFLLFIPRQIIWILIFLFTLLILYFARLFSATIATTLENLGRTITTDFEGNPTLYITRVRKNNQDYIYVNNAQIIRSRSNVQLENGKKRKQVKYGKLIEKKSRKSYPFHIFNG